MTPGKSRPFCLDWPGSRKMMGLLVRSCITVKMGHVGILLKKSPKEAGLLKTDAVLNYLLVQNLIMSIFKTQMITFYIIYEQETTEKLHFQGNLTFLWLMKVYVYDTQNMINLIRYGTFNSNLLSNVLLFFIWQITYLYCNISKYIYSGKKNIQNK